MILTQLFRHGWLCLVLALLACAPLWWLLTRLIGGWPYIVQFLVGFVLGGALGILAAECHMQTVEYDATRGMVLPFWMRRHRWEGGGQ